MATASEEKLKDALRSLMARGVRYHAPHAPEYAIVKQLDPVQALRASDDDLLTEDDDLLFSHAVKQYDADYGIKVDDTLVLHLMEDGNYAAVEVLHDEDVGSIGSVAAAAVAAAVDAAVAAAVPPAVAAATAEETWQADPAGDYLNSWDDGGAPGLTLIKRGSVVQINGYVTKSGGVGVGWAGVETILDGIPAEFRTAAGETDYNLAAAAVLADDGRLRWGSPRVTPAGELKLSLLFDATTAAALDDSDAEVWITSTYLTSLP